MTGYKLLVTAIALSLTPAFAANSADSTSSSASQPSASASSASATPSVQYRSGPTKRGRGVAFCFNKFYRNKQYQPR